LERGEGGGAWRGKREVAKVGGGAAVLLITEKRRARGWREAGDVETMASFFTRYGAARLRVKGEEREFSYRFR
jgi:hypothetical protein